MVIITFELVDRSDWTSSNVIGKEKLCCFKGEAFPDPWDKQVKKGC
jgi:hypothetical protein